MKFPGRQRMCLCHPAYRFEKFLSSQRTEKQETTQIKGWRTKLLKRNKDSLMSL